MFVWALPFKPMTVSENWFDWPALPDLFPVSFPGVKTSRDGFLIDTDLDRLRARVSDYFDSSLSHEEIARRYPGVMSATARFDARMVREALLKRGGPDEAGFIRFAYRPFDHRWLYWEPLDTKQLEAKRADFLPACNRRQFAAWDRPTLLSIHVPMSHMALAFDDHARSGSRVFCARCYRITAWYA